MDGLKLLERMLFDKYEAQFQGFDLIPLSDDVIQALKAHAMMLCVSCYLDGLVEGSKSGEC